MSALAQSFFGASCFGASSADPADIIINSAAETTAILIMIAAARSTAPGAFMTSQCARCFGADCDLAHAMASPFINLHLAIEPSPQRACGGEGPAPHGLKMPDLKAYDKGWGTTRPCSGVWYYLLAWSRSALSSAAAPNAVRSGTTGCNRRNPANRTISRLASRELGVAVSAVVYCRENAGSIP